MKSILIFSAGALVGAASLFYFLQNDFATTSLQAITLSAPVTDEPVQDAPTTGASPAPEPLAPLATAALEPAASAVTTSLTRTSAAAATPSDTPPAEIQDENLSPAEPLPLHPGALLIPVTGIAATQLNDTFDDKRGSERIHEALDIMAPLQTPVVAVDDGKVVKLFNSVPGGLTIYQYDASGTFAYYYAHLDSYAADLEEGQELKRGDLIGYVGATGNANALAPHLHFAIFLLGPEKQWWKGTAINPYPLFQH
ncbi:MAG: peptidoglycan DD-metalloendopeptidase family protein [Pseudomonas sp.]|uniref:M23 family metallopeptidase n=1 Tax=Pseudomonas sp. TaxID=306 RepID=UPI00299E079A|nr:peptidoglycan DD-metalloendopeptidase family protein [Pseudomonas sp.]MDX1725834.1 peptidoglycan DD-metalloendopeptidase family protein [Pseudomonas sp.]